MSWSIITEDYTYIHWLLKNSTEQDVVKPQHEGHRIMEDEEIWTCTVGATQEVPQEDELYDRRSDPFQLQNIIAERPDKAGELLRELKLYIGELRTL